MPIRFTFTADLADLADLHLDETTEDRLATAIEARATTLWELGCSVEGLAASAAALIAAAGFGCHHVMPDVTAEQDDEVSIVLGVLTHASVDEF